MGGGKLTFDERVVLHRVGATYSEYHVENSPPQTPPWLNSRSLNPQTPHPNLHPFRVPRGGPVCRSLLTSARANLATQPDFQNLEPWILNPSPKP